MLKMVSYIRFLIIDIVQERDGVSDLLSSISFYSLNLIYYYKILNDRFLLSSDYVYKIELKKKQQTLYYIVFKMQSYCIYNIKLFWA